MTREDRNRLIDLSSSMLTLREYEYIKKISAYIGDDSIIDISYDDLMEITDISCISKIEELLQLMFDLEILTTLDFTNNEMG